MWGTVPHIRGFCSPRRGGGKNIANKKVCQNSLSRALTHPISTTCHYHGMRYKLRYQ